MTLPETAVATAPAHRSGVPVPQPGRSRFYTGMTLVAFAIVVAGFAPSTIFSGHRRAPLTAAVAAHAAVFTAWLVLLLVQTRLVGRGRIATHRRLGYAGGGLAVLMVVTGFGTAVAMARRGFDLSGDLRADADPLGQMVFQLGDLLTFSVLVAAGIAFRRRPEAHKRLMMLATLGGLMAAPLAHLLSHIPAARKVPPVILLPLVALYFSCAVHDRLTRGRIHPVSLWVAIALFAWANLRAAVVGPSPAWRRFAGWLAES